MKIIKKQKIAKEWFIKLQNIICKNVEELEKEYGSKKNLKGTGGNMENLEK